MRILALLATLFLASAAQAGPIEWAKHHKRFLLTEGAAIGASAFTSAGVHHCREVNGVEPCLAHYGAAWATQGFDSGMIVIVFPAVAEGCWRDSTPNNSPWCGILSWIPSAAEFGFGVKEWRTHEKEVDLSSVVLVHHYRKTM